MPPPPHSRPENVLKRAQELIGVGQASAALSIIHEHVVSKRTRNSPIASLEPVMLLFVELCVDLRRGKLAKDGLYQYKNTAQNTNVGTIELVFKKFIELAEQKVTEAQAKADLVQSNIDETTASAGVDDLEASETPESILLSTVSGEQSKDRTDRAIVTPWLKFLWETYRTVLDIFKNNSRLEIMYQSTAHQAFTFCSKYQRKTEFRRLCELLRNHLQNVAKFSAQMHAINLSDTDTLQRHLDTRFSQLNVAVELELWQEAFRSVEDIHTLLSLSKRPAKPIMMANYFEKLTRIFLVSENYLFHAAAWSRYYNLLRQSASAVGQGQPKKDHPPINEAEITKAASFVLLSALSIPVISTSRSRGALVDVDEARKSKNVRLTTLLGMAHAPTRAILFKDAMSKGLLKRCRPEIRELYNILEVDFHPLSICKRISPILAQIGTDAEMEKYVLPLQQVILTRLFQQLSQVYESVKLDFVLDLAQFPEPFDVSSSTIEKFIMNGCKKGDLAIRIDHTAGVLTFDSDVFSSGKALHPGAGAGSAESEVGTVQRLQSTPAEIVRSQLTRLAKALFVTCQYVDPSFNEERNKAKAAALERAKAGANKEHVDILARREIIDRKKQAASSALAQKEKDLATQKRLKAQEQQAAEAQRLAEEQRERDRRRLEAERQRVQHEEAQKALEELKRGTKNIDLGDVDVTDLDTGAIRAIKIRALEKEKNDLNEKLRLTGRRIDHLERAFRREELKHISEDYTAQRDNDLKAYEKLKAETLKEAEQKHKDDVALKHRLTHLVPAYESFRATIRQQRNAQFEREQKKAKQELENKMNARRREHRERKLREIREQREAEQRRREEEERRAIEEEERARAEEEKARADEERRARREEERRKLDEKLALQRAQEEKAEAKLAARKAQAAGLGPRIPSRDKTGLQPSGDQERPSGGPPRLNLQPRTTPLPAGASGWREKQAAAGGAGTAAAASSSRTEDRSRDDSSKRGGYVPPALREGGAPTERWRPREASGRGGIGRNESPSTSASGGYAPPAGRGDRFSRDMGERGSGARGRLDVRDRGESPAAGASGSSQRWVPPALRNQARDDSPATSDGGSRPPPVTSTDGKYRPGAFSKREQ